MLSASTANELITALNALLKAKVQRGSTDAFFISDANAIIQIARNPEAGTGEGGSSVEVYKVTSITNISSDYIKAKPVTFDSSNAETLGDEVNVALPWALRDAQITTRTPEYAVNDYIVVAEVPDGAGVVVSSVQLTLVDVGIGRSGTADVMVKMAKIQSSGIQQDHVVVKEWNGSSEVGSAFNVAKPFKLRYAASESIDGVTVTYSSYASTTYVTRTASYSGVTEKQVIVPRLQIGDIILIAQVSHTGVTVSSTELTWIDLNVDARAWCRKNDQS